MKTKKAFVCGLLAVIFALAFVGCGDGSDDDKTDGGQTGGQTKTFTVTFNSNGGNNVSSQTVAEGDKAAKPADPTKDPSLIAGLWPDTPGTSSYTFAGWQKDGAAYDFDTPVTANITLTAAWTVTVPTTPSPIDLTTRSEANIIAKSVAYINADDSGTTEYTLVLNANVTDVAKITHNKKEVTLTITSVDKTERTISKGTENETMFHVGGDGMTGSNAKLVIDGNITLQGNNKNGPVVYVFYGGRLELKGSAKITGNTGYNAGGVYANAGVTITMSGNAEISGNTTSSTNSSGYGGGGVYLGSNANLTMSDNAAIKNNIISGYDDSLGGGVYIDHDGTFTMNGGEISGNTATTSADATSAKGGGVFIRDESDPEYYESGSFIVASEAVKANIKNNTVTITNTDNTSGTAEGAQVYKMSGAVFTVGGESADTY